MGFGPMKSYVFMVIVKGFTCVRYFGCGLSPSRVWRHSSPSPTLGIPGEQGLDDIIRLRACLIHFHLFEVDYKQKLL